MGRMKTEVKAHTHTHKQASKLARHSAYYRSQSAMEYLMTYGWAILIIAVVLGALFSLGVFNGANFAPKAPPGACQVFRPNGPGTTSFVNLEGVCNGELPEYVASFETSPAYVLIANDPYLPSAPAASRSIITWIDPTTIPHSTNPDIFGGTVFTMPPIGSRNLDVCGAFNLLISNWNALFLHKCINDITSAVHSYENTWEFVAVVYNNASDTVTFYIDSQVNVQTNNGMYPASQNLTAGGWDTNANTITGYISNFQVYNTSLSQPEINALYTEGIGGAPIDLQNLVGWWPLNGNANDYSGNNNDGTASNVIYTSSWTSGYSAP